MLDRLCYALTMKKIKGNHLDFCQIAHAVVEAATDEEPIAEEPSNKNPHAVALGRLGGQKGGRARASKLTPEQRSEISRLAAVARWKKTEEYD